MDKEHVKKCQHPSKVYQLSPLRWPGTIFCCIPVKIGMNNADKGSSAGSGSAVIGGETVNGLGVDERNG